MLLVSGLCGFIYSFLILWLEYGLCGFLNFNNILCRLFVAFVDLYKSLFLKSTCDMVLIWLHVDSVSIYIEKSIKPIIETKF